MIDLASDKRASPYGIQITRRKGRRDAAICVFSERAFLKIGTVIMSRKSRNVASQFIFLEMLANLIKSQKISPLSLKINKQVIWFSISEKVIN